MTYKEAKTCKPGDRVIFKFGRFKGNEAVITDIDPIIRREWIFFAVESEVTQNPYWVTHTKITLKSHAD